MPDISVVGTLFKVSSMTWCGQESNLTPPQQQADTLPITGFFKAKLLYNQGRLVCPSFNFKHADFLLFWQQFLNILYLNSFATNLLKFCLKSYVCIIFIQF